MGAVEEAQLVDVLIEAPLQSMLDELEGKVDKEMHLLKADCMHKSLSRM